MAGAHNVVLIGGPGTGKTHIATALGVQPSMPIMNSTAKSTLLQLTTEGMASPGATGKSSAGTAAGMHAFPAAFGL